MRRMAAPAGGFSGPETATYSPGMSSSRVCRRRPRHCSRNESACQAVAREASEGCWSTLETIGNGKSPIGAPIGERLDDGTVQASVGADSDLQTLGEIHGTEESGLLEDDGLRRLPEPHRDTTSGRSISLLTRDTCIVACASTTAVLHWLTLRHRPIFFRRVESHRLAGNCHGRLRPAT